MSDTTKTQAEIDAENVQTATQASKDAYDILHNAYMKSLQQQKAEVGSQYEQAKAEAYSTAKVSAQAENEALAAQGLAGKSYASPTSGYSEFSRLKTDLALQNNLQTLSTEQREAVNTLSNLMAEQEATRLSTFAGYDLSAQETINTNRLTQIENKINAGLELTEDEIKTYNSLGSDYATQLQVLGSSSGDMYAYNRYNLLQGADSKVKTFVQNYDTTGSLTNPATTDSATLSKAIIQDSSNFTTSEIKELLNVYGMTTEEFMNNVISDADLIKQYGSKIDQLYADFGLEKSTSYTIAKEMSSLQNTIDSTSTDSATKVKAQNKLNFMEKVNSLYSSSIGTSTGTNAIIYSLSASGTGQYGLDADDIDDMLSTYGISEDEYYATLSTNDQYYAGIVENATDTSSDEYLQALAYCYYRSLSDANNQWAKKHGKGEGKTINVEDLIKNQSESSSSSSSSSSTSTTSTTTTTTPKTISYAYKDTKHTNSTNENFYITIDGTGYEIEFSGKKYDKDKITDDNLKQVGDSPLYFNESTHELYHLEGDTLKKMKEESGKDKNNFSKDFDDLIDTIIDYFENPNKTTSK